MTEESSQEQKYTRESNQHARGCIDFDPETATPDNVEAARVTRELDFWASRLGLNETTPENVRAARVTRQSIGLGR